MPETEIAPFELTVSGRSELPLPAERALINVAVSSQGPNKATTSNEVISTAKNIESMLRDLGPKDDSAEAKEAAPLAHWNKTSLSSTSFIPHNNNREELPRQYKATVTFDIRFRDFKALGTFGTRISSLAHVEVQNIDWILTAATEKSYRSRLRREAAMDAREKARDYCEVLGCKNVRPVELNEGQNYVGAPRGRMPVSFQQMQMPASSARQMSSVVGQQQQQQMMKQQQMQMAAMGSSGPPSDIKDEDLEFRPQEVHMNMEITIRFHADPPKFTT